MNKEKAAAAKALFMEGYNCSQAVVGAWAEDIGLDSETAYKIASGFGGGIGRMREVCGAFTGAVMVLGLKFGNTIGSDRAAKGKDYERVQLFAKRFKEELGSDTIICRELLGLSGPSDPDPAKRTKEYYQKRPCPETVAIASGLLGEFMEQFFQKKTLKLWANAVLPYKIMQKRAEKRDLCSFFVYKFCQIPAEQFGASFVI